MAQPPAYSPQPAILAMPYTPTTPRLPRHPSFRQRKSSTIISVIASSSEESLAGTSTASASGTLVTDSPGQGGMMTEHGDGDGDGDGGDSGVSTSSLPSFSSVDPYNTNTSPSVTPPASALPHYLTHTRKESLERRSSATSDSSSAAEEGEATPLIHPDIDGSIASKWYTGPLFVTAVKLSILFFIFTAVVVGTFWFGIPSLDEADKGVLKLPRSFADLQAMNGLFQKYKERNPYRILACGVVSYLFVQTFSLPGSMYISIIFGAAYGMLYGLFLSCLCESVGALFCYTLSALLAPPLLALPFYRARVETWRVKIMGDPAKGKAVSWDGIAAFLIVLRIAPFPPHWVANFVAPHLGIGPFFFWATCFIGIAPVSVIHVTIGSSLDKMTSAEDFHILSLRNILGLGAVIVAVLIPVGLKRIFKADLGELGEAEALIQESSIVDDQVDVTAIHPAYGPVPVEIDEHGHVRRYQAVDSGVILAGPSGGDPSLDLDLERDLPRSHMSRKGKGRVLEIIADVDEEEEEENAQGEYKVYDTQGRLERVAVTPRSAPAPATARDEKRKAKGRMATRASGTGKGAFKGYGSFEPSPIVERTDQTVQSGWMGFAR